MMVGTGASIIRCIYMFDERNAEVVPVDMSVNGLLASAWDAANTNYPELPVYNYVVPPNNKLTWRKFNGEHLEQAYLVPWIKATWYYCVTSTSSWWYYLFLRFFYHIVPAAIVDGVLILRGRKPKLVVTIKYLV